MVELAQTHSLEVGVPTKCRVLLCKLAAGCRVVVSRHITKLYVRAEHLRHLSLKVEHSLRLLVSICPADEAESLCKPCDVALALCCILLVEVVVTVAHAQATLLNVEGIHIRVQEVSTHAHIKERRTCYGVQVSHHLRKLGEALHRHNLLDIRHHRSHTLGIEAYRVQTHSIEVGNLLLDGTLLCLSLGHSVEKFVNAHLVILAHHIEYAIASELRLQRILRLPATCSVLVEVLVESHALVKICAVDSRSLLTAVATCHNCNGC